MTKQQVLNEAFVIRNNLKANKDFECNPIDMSLDPVPPFSGDGEIKLIILGQDPTIKNLKTRSKISHTLNLNKKGSLKNYIDNICGYLGINPGNIYATNVFKYFYTVPPAETPEVLFAHLDENLELLKKEFAQFPDVPVLTLGEPVLQLLAGQNAKVNVFWDYNRKTKCSNGNYTCCDAVNNKLGRKFFPFPHQPSIRKEFYKNHLAYYSSFMKNNIP